MWSKQVDCNRAAIDQFLVDQLSAEEQASFEDHLGACTECRRILKTRAAEPALWDEVRETLGAGEFPCREEPCGTSLPVDDGAVEDRGEDLLTLLKPTDDPQMLGRFGGYEVVGLIGRGGMGTVLKGLDSSLNRYVAIKVLSPHLAASSAARARFAREARAAAAVVHDNVIAIHSVAEDNGFPYLVMPYERGVSLQKRLDRAGSLSLVEVLRIAAQAAAGLAAAHTQGLVHRDVKPGNILLADGVERVKLTDFGLARAADDASLTRTGVIAGTPQFMSPEQARGDRVDHRSDLFSLGSVLYAMCTGRPPFRAETSYGVLRRITDTGPRPIREINPEVPEWLAAIINKLMAKQPDGRFGSAEEVAALLEGCLAHVQQPTATPLPEGAQSLVRQADEPVVPRVRGPIADTAARFPRLTLLLASAIGMGALIGIAALCGLFPEDRDADTPPTGEAEAAFENPRQSPALGGGRNTTSSHERFEPPVSKQEAIPAATPIAVAGMLDLDQDGVDDTADLAKYGFEVVARVTPDGRRIGPPLTPSVRYLVVDAARSEEAADVTFEQQMFATLLDEQTMLAKYGENHPKVKAIRRKIRLMRESLGNTPLRETDSLRRRVALESKRIRDEAKENGVSIISTEHFQTCVDAVLEARQGDDEDARCRWLIEQIEGLQVGREEYLASIAQTELQIIELSKPIEIPEDADEETVERLAETKRLNEAKARQLRHRAGVLEDQLMPYDAQIKFLRRRLADFSPIAVALDRHTSARGSPSNAANARESGEKDRRLLEARHKELREKRDHLYKTVVLLELAIIDCDQPVVIPEQSVVIPKDTVEAEQVRRAAEEDVRRRRDERLLNQRKVEQIRKRLSASQAELRGVEQEMALLEERMKGGTVPPVSGSAKADAAETGGPLVVFKFENQAWKPVLEWVASKQGLSLVIDALPPGTLTYADSQPKSPGEVIDVLNDILLPKGYALVVSEDRLRVVRTGPAD